MSNEQTSPDAVRHLVSHLTANAKVAATELGEVKRVHTALAKAEVAEKITKPAAAAIGLFVFAAVLLLDFLMLAFITAAVALRQLDLPWWACFGIVTLTVLVVSLVVGAVGIHQAKKIGPPERTINAGKHLVTRLKEAVSGVV